MYPIGITTSNEEEYEGSLFLNENMDPILSQLHNSILRQNTEKECEKIQFMSENVDNLINKLLNKVKDSGESLFSKEEESDSEESLFLKEVEESQERQFSNVAEESEESQYSNEVVSSENTHLNEVVSSDENTHPNEVVSSDENTHPNEVVSSDENTHPNEVSSDENTHPNEEHSILIQHSKRQCVKSKRKLVENQFPNKVKSKKKRFRTKGKSKKEQFQTKEVKWNNRQFQNKEEQRLYHNELEKSRRRDLSKKYSEVQDSLPCFRNVDKSKISREVIVIKAAEYIIHQPKLEDVKLEVEKNTREIENFKRKMAEYDEAVRNGDNETIERLEKFEPPIIPTYEEQFGLSKEAPSAPLQKKRKII